MQKLLGLSTPLDSLREEILRRVDEVTSRMSIPFLLVGATSRDLLLQHLHGIPTGRATVDVDLAVLVEDWPRYERLVAALVETGAFERSPSQTQRLLYRTGSAPVDIIPFGEVGEPGERIVGPKTAEGKAVSRYNRSRERARPKGR